LRRLATLATLALAFAAFFRHNSRSKWRRACPAAGNSVEASRPQTIMHATKTTRKTLGK